MTPALDLDVGAASRLISLDPALAQLHAALPRGSDAETRSWRLHDARWAPGRGCRLAYHVSAPGGTATFVDISVTATGWTRHDYLEDAQLPGLAEAADAGRVAARLEHVLGEQVARCTIEPVRYRPGLRCVLRYDIRTASRRLVCFAKVLRAGEFDVVAPIVAALADAPGSRALVPPLTGVWPDAHTIVMEAVPGQSVSAVLRDGRRPAGERAQVAAGLGRLLARFHAQAGVVAPPWSPQDQLATLEESLDAAQCVDGQLATRLREVVHRLAVAAPAGSTEVLAHGALRAGQVVLGPDDGLVLLDVDGVCRSDPGRDLGSVLAHLRWQGLCLPHQKAALAGAGEALLAGYREKAGPLDGQAVTWWLAAGLLQVAVRRFRRLETRDWGRVPALVDAAAELVATSAPRPSPRTSRELLDVRHMSVVLGRALGARSRTPGRVSVVSATELASASGRRAVVRYRVRGLDGPDDSLVVGKAFAEPLRAQLLHEHLRLLSAAHVGSIGDGSAIHVPGSGVPVPEPLAHVPELGLVVYRHLEGTPLIRLTDPAALRYGVRGAARWLAAMHSRRVTLPRSLSLDTEVVTTHAWAEVVGRAHPDLAAHADAIADRWAAEACTDRPALQVPLHKDFHPGHVLVGDGVHVIDLDEARQGDPVFDVGHFSAYAELLDGGPSMATAFLEEYAAATGWADRGALASFQAYAWLKIARQWATGAAPFRAATASQRRTGIEQALARGLRCLDG